MRGLRGVLILGLFAVLLSACKSSQVPSGGGAPPADSSSGTQAAVLKITELDPSGRKVNVDDRTKVIDPNSDLEFAIDPQAIFQRTASKPMSTEFTTQLAELKAMIEQETAAMKSLGNAIAAYQAGDSNYTSYLGELSVFTNAILKPGTRTNAMYEALEEADDMTGEYANLFVVARERVKEMTDELQASAAREGIKVRFAAWIQNGEGIHSVHIPGFDEFKDDPYRVEQFQVVLTEDQQKEMRALSDLAARANRDGLANAINAKEKLKQALTQALAATLSQARTLNDNVEKHFNDARLSVVNVKQALQLSNLQLKAFHATVSDVVKKYGVERGTDAAAVALEVNADLDRILTEARALKANLVANAKTIRDNVAATAGEVRAGLTQLESDMNALAAALEGDVEKIKTDVTGFLRAIVAGESFRTATFEFATEVRRLSLNDVPLNASLSLENAGERDLGDRFVVRLAAEKADGTTMPLFDKRYHLYFCSAYMRTSTSFIWVDPVPLFEPVIDKALFTYGASYSILLKGFLRGESARKKLGYHKLFSPGIGINIATLDFDSNGAFEVGFGGVLSVFNDLIQIGGGFNTFDGTGYTFFGLSLPMRSIPLGQ